MIKNIFSVVLVLLSVFLVGTAIYIGIKNMPSGTYASHFDKYCKDHAGILRSETPMTWGSCLMPSGIVVQEQQIIPFLK